MKSNKVYGHIQSLIRREENFLLVIETIFLLDKGKEIEKSIRKIEVEFSLDNPSICPVNEFEQNCMMLLDEFNDTTIILEENEIIREQYLIGKLIDKISYDIISKTNLTSFYQQTHNLSQNSLN